MITITAQEIINEVHSYEDAVMMVSDTEAIIWPNNEASENDDGANAVARYKINKEVERQLYESIPGYIV